MTTFRVTDGGKSLRIEIRPEGVLVEIDSGCGTCSVVMSHEKAREAGGWIFDRTPVMGAAPPGRSCMLCRHHVGVAPSVFCRHPKAMRDDPVSGRKAPATAHSQRIEGKECGPQGDRWEALIIGT